MAAILNLPQIISYSPKTPLIMSLSGGRLISEPCRLTVRVNFTNGNRLNCALRVHILKSQSKYFNLEPNSADSNMYEIYRYYGYVSNRYTDTFDFFLSSNESIAKIKAYASPADIVVTVYDCDHFGVGYSTSCSYDIS